MKNGVRLDAFLVDRKYCGSIKRKIVGYDVLPLDEFISKNEKIDIVVGFEGDYEKNLESIDLERIHKIYAADFLGFLALDEENYISDKFYFENESRFIRLQSLFEDDKSRKMLDDFIEQKRFGTYSKNYEKGRQYFDLELLGESMDDNEVFVDCGAFQGETTKEFILFLQELNIPSFSKIYSCEADLDNVRILRNNLSGFPNVKIVDAGVYDKSGRLSFCSNDGSSSRVAEGGNDSIAVVSIDDLVKDDRVTFIKMDIEGSELKALQGATETIKRCQPKLAICIYHKPEDLIEIPQFILSLELDYKFYLRSYLRCGVETVFYAIPR